jgi:hypothetical protein
MAMLIDTEAGVGPRVRQAPATKASAALRNPGVCAPPPATHVDHHVWRRVPVNDKPLKE